MSEVLPPEQFSPDELMEALVAAGVSFILIGGLEVDWRGHRIRICSLARLREMKQAADRPLDRLDLEALDTAHGQD